MLDSRVQTTVHLYQYLEKRRIFPKCIISGSAVGYYGIDFTTGTGQQYVTEHSAAQDIFMSQLCQQSEHRYVLSFSQQKTKIMRLGVGVWTRWRHFTANCCYQLV